ncbi:HTH domain-containing protein [Roseibium aggregatum]|uniref:HTH domain-containing protein n=1 Tax=Roseibium aggregatum TaxID=187304 RepID=A0A926P5F4_9HYPH|nr:HTH domain-containing protein [Roseibium aggregatum]MBD1548291.1 HTH domain-containing protein [Roseibium aggregatum]
MDSLITAAGRALAGGDPLGALKRVALRDDAPALALRGIAMAQLGDLPLARELLRKAARAFGSMEPMHRARCQVAEAEIALVSRDLGKSLQALGPARAALSAHGDRTNAAYAGFLEARRLLLIGQLDAAERMLAGIDIDTLPPAARPGYELVTAGIAMRRIRAKPARDALERAALAARETGIPALEAEVGRAVQAFEAPAARLITRDGERMLKLGDVEALLASDALVVDACRNALRCRQNVVPLASRPVLFSLLRALAEGWPGDVAREALLTRAFGARHADESHRGRLRVEIGRLREAIRPQTEISATSQGFVLQPKTAAAVVVLAPPVEEEHGDILALLADDEAWSSSALAQALGVSPRTVQRALYVLSETGKVERFGRGPACRWIASAVPGFPTSLLLPASAINR